MFDIVTGTLMLTLPLLICNITLLSIVFLYRIPESSAETLSRGAVYLDISATLFTTIASWSSTVSPLLAGFMILLASYPAAAHMVRGYRESRAEALPTPYQFAMMLQYRSGAFFRVIVDTCVYLTSYKRVRARFPPPLLIMSVAFCINTSLSLFIFATDTWLHIATTSENIIRYASSPGANLSLALVDECLDSTNTGEAGVCTINSAAAKAYLMSYEGSPSPGLVLNNASDHVIAKRHRQDGRYYAYLAPADTPINVVQDYTAYTYAMSTDECRTLTKECGLVASTNSMWPFNCSGVDDFGFFGGNLAEDWWQVGYYDTNDRSIYYEGVPNPVQYIAAVYLPGDWPLPENAVESSAVMQTGRADYGMVFQCRTTMFDVVYETKNDSVVYFDAKPTNRSAFNALSGPIRLTAGADLRLQHAFSAAGASGSMDEMLAKWAIEYDSTAIAMAVTGLRTVPAFSARERTPLLVARVPLAPLLSLVVANFLYVAVGLVLAAVAIVAGRDHETKEAVERLSIASMTALLFESERALRPVEKLEDMYREFGGEASSRIAVGKSTEGGYTYYVT
ncbi:unnamed protein product [Parascedosporium putredinis]|uniref:Uncharacterized protein n=1 Tax=Parascedosporium putredinis TaxID=1442378 RepID=A0A9P1H627_9PEZI|nr:unnamed protein product [Parascedosporium putredinis]CAI7997050.1 unnamed protein product [Parascedosporium putredinis]